MTRILFLLVSSLSFSALAFEMPGATLLKECKTQVVFPADDAAKPPESHRVDIKIFQKDQNLIGTFTNYYNGSPFTKSFQMTAGQYPVRAGLTGTLQTNDELNLGEGLIDQAMYLIEIPQMKEIVKLSFDLKQVRFVKVWKVVEPEANLGLTAVVEASDEKGQILGTFFGGMLVSECQ